MRRAAKHLLLPNALPAFAPVHANALASSRGEDALSQPHERHLAIRKPPKRYAVQLSHATATLPRSVAVKQTREPPNGS